VEKKTKRGSVGGGGGGVRQRKVSHCEITGNIARHTITHTYTHNLCLLPASTADTRQGEREGGGGVGGGWGGWDMYSQRGAGVVTLAQEKDR
jgi:hypothetical protein